MKKLFSTISLFMLAVMSLSAQSALVGTGGEASGSGGSVSYSVGQIAVQSNSEGNTSISEGVQQPYEIQTIGIDNYPGITLNAVVYPNPTQGTVILSIDSFDSFSDIVFARLYDGNGKQIRVIRIADHQTEIGMESLSTGTYYLNLFSGKQMLKSFKVVKTSF